MFTLTGSTDDVLSVTADTGDVLILSGITASTVPEPGSLLLLGTGLLGAGAMLRRRFRA